MIGELPVRYAMALDGRDIDALVGLFVEDVEAGRRGSGREALKAWFDKPLRGFGRSIHLVCGHTVEFVDDDRATGRVYCRAEHEDGPGWYVMTMRYDDVYERRGNQWYFVSRRERLWYVVDVLDRPSAPFIKWPGRESMKATLPESFPTWTTFWDRDSNDPRVAGRYLLWNSALPFRTPAPGLNPITYGRSACVQSSWGSQRCGRWTMSSYRITLIRHTCSGGSLPP